MELVDQTFKSSNQLTSWLRTLDLLRSAASCDEPSDYAISEQKRKLVEQVWGWMKTVGGLRTLRPFRGEDRLPHGTTRSRRSPRVTIQAQNAGRDRDTCHSLHIRLLLN
jgi:hypothetical protein